MPTAAELLEELKASKQPMDEVAMRMKALIYGQAGVGKTVEAAHLAQLVTPPDKKILHMDTGEGWVSLQNHPQLKKRMDRMVYKGMAQIKLLVDAIQANVEGFDDYGTLIFDEFSTSTKQFLHVVLDATGVKKMTEAPEFKHWGIMSRNIEETLWALLKLKETHNLIFLAHERTKKDKATAIERIHPSFMDSIEGTVKENVHIVARMTAEVQNREGAPTYLRQMQVHPTKLVIAKSRVGGLDILVHPNTFNEVVVDWLAKGGKLVDESEVVELDSEKVVSKRLASQDDEYGEFSGFEVESEE